MSNICAFPQYVANGCAGCPVTDQQDCYPVDATGVDFSCPECSGSGYIGREVDQDGNRTGVCGVCHGTGDLSGEDLKLYPDGEKYNTRIANDTRVPDPAIVQTARSILTAYIGGAELVSAEAVLAVCRELVRIAEVEG